MDSKFKKVLAAASNSGGGGDITVTPLNVTQNGTYVAPSGKAYTPVNVDVSGGSPDLVDVTITENGVYNHDSHDGYDEVTVNVPQLPPTLEDKTIISNGVYEASEGYDGLGEVTVNVPQPTGNINITSMSQVDVSNYATAQVVDADLIASNIKKDVDILGVVGTYEGGGGGGGNFASGEFTPAENITNDYIVATVSELGFIPKAFVLVRYMSGDGFISTILGSAFIANGNAIYAFSLSKHSPVSGNYAGYTGAAMIPASSGLATTYDQASGGFGTVIKIRAASTYQLPAGITYKWYALG